MDLSLSGRLRLGASSCLLGEPVRYDGADARDHWVADRLGAFSDWVRICPEAEAGLGTPRPPIRMVLDGSDLRVREVESAADHTEQLLGWTERRLGDLDLASLDGYVLKSRSPSCGTRDVAVHAGDREVEQRPGMFASALMAADPLLPVCSEADLQVPEARRHFLERAFARARWRRFLEDCRAGSSRVEEELPALLARHDLVLLCRERSPLRLESRGACDPAAVAAAGRLLQDAMGAEPTVRGHVDALAVVFERLRGVLEDERAGLGILIDQAQRGAIDVEVPRQLARGLVARAGDAWLRGQHYLDPFPVLWRQPDASTLPFTPAAG